MREIEAYTRRKTKIRTTHSIHHNLWYTYLLF